MDVKQDQEQRLRKFLSGAIFAGRKEGILVGRALLLSPPMEQDRWHFTPTEAQDIVRKYHPELSATVYEKRMVIFHQRPKD